MTKNVLGIDVSKKKIDTYLMIGEKGFAKQFDNTEKGMKLLGGWLRSLHVEQVHVCLEATGTYHETAAQALYDAGHIVSVVNPFQTASYGGAELRRNKTDKIDAQKLARFCRQENPREWHPLPPEMMHLQALTRRIGALEEMIRMEQNRRGTAPKQARKSIDRVIALLRKEIESLQKEVNDFIKRNPDLREQKDLLTSIPGIGDKSALLLLSEIDFDRFDSARSVAAFAGVTPAKSDSGTSRHSTRMSKIGSARVRSGLFMSAVVATHHNQIVKEFASRLAENGKTKMQIVCAAIRKLLHIAFGVLKHHTPYTSNPT